MSFRKLIKEVEEKRIMALNRISRVPISALIWGPDPNGKSKTAKCRKKLKEILSNSNVYACFSEDLFDPLSNHSNLAQQVAQVEAFDIVISIPDSPGSIAEIHDFAMISAVSSKIVCFLDSRWNSGYANSALINMLSPISIRIKFYDYEGLANCVIHQSLELIKTLRESYYIRGRR